VWALIRSLRSSVQPKPAASRLIQHSLKQEESNGRRDGGSFEHIATVVETEHRAMDQPRGVELDYRAVRDDSGWTVAVGSRR